MFNGWVTSLGPKTTFLSRAGKVHVYNVLGRWLVQKKLPKRKWLTIQWCMLQLRHCVQEEGYRYYSVKIDTSEYDWNQR